MTDAMTHDPGGKRLFDMPKGMNGDAHFHGERGEYRLWLSRSWTSRAMDGGYALWIGMNPSTATGGKNDPTIVREIGFTMRFDQDRLFGPIGAYVKVNVLDYRATHQDDLRKPGVVACSPLNHPNILMWARGARAVICAWGSLHRSLNHHAIEVETMLRRAGIELYCLGRTEGGAPKHPVRLAKDTPLVHFGELPV